MTDADRGEIAPTARSVAKANRRQALLDAAAELFAQRGFNGVSIEELGAAAGVSGPAVYRHFEGKHAVLAALLTEVSEALLTDGREVLRAAPDAASGLTSLIGFHVNFALGHPDIIRVQDRDLAHLHPEHRETVRALQRDYMRLWVTALGELQPGSEPAELRLRVHAAFGLINSTSHSLGSRGAVRGSDHTTAASARSVLERMTAAAVLA